MVPDGSAACKSGAFEFYGDCVITKPIIKTICLSSRNHLICGIQMSIIPIWLMNNFWQNHNAEYISCWTTH